MEKMNFIMFCLGAGSLFVGLLIQPYVKMGWQWCKSLISHKKPTPPTMWYCDDLQSQVDELKQQLDNVAETLATRDRNRKYNLRRDVRDYLAELRNDK